MGIHACLHPMPSCCTSSQVQVKLSDGLDNLNCNHTSCAALRTVDKLPCGYLGTVFWVKFTLEREWAKTTWLSLCQMRASTTRMPAVSQGRLERPAVRCTSLQLPAATFAFPLRVDTSRHDHARMTFPWQKDVPNTKSISRDSVAGCLSSFRCP